MNSEEEILIRRYLLGEVDDDEQTIVEQRLMLDKPYFHDYLMLEERLAASARNEEDLRSRLREQEAQDGTLTEQLHDLQAQLALRSQESQQWQSGWGHSADIPVISLVLQPSLDRGETGTHSIHLS